MYIVLDKSFLQGATEERIKNLCSEHQVIIPEVLLLEILTTENEEQGRACIAKFSHIDNPVNLIPNIGTLIKYEVKNHKPCTPIASHFIKERFVLNKDFVLSKKQSSILSNQETEVSKDSLRFIKKAVVTQEWFPKLKVYKPGMPTTEIEKYMETIANNSTFVKEKYEPKLTEIHQIDNQEWPDSKIINHDWAIYRYYQVHLVYALEYIKRYGFSYPDEIKKKLHNFRIDIDYCVIGALADGLLTNDNMLAQLYNLICPEKSVIRL